MHEDPTALCPECQYGVDIEIGMGRRSFLQAAGSKLAFTIGASTLLGRIGLGATPKPPAKKTRPAEELVKELFSTLTVDQKKTLVLPFDHREPKRKDLPTRLGMYNAPIQDKQIGQHYTVAQQELIERTLRAISSGDDGYRCLSRDGTFDGSESLQGCGALFFGEPVERKDWTWVFSGHHLTVRCDGRPNDGIGFGGPMYYGHSPNGYSDRNVFFFQTKSVLSVFDALDEKQRKLAVVNGSPGEQYSSVRFRARGESRPGISCSELKKDQKALVETVMRNLLSPYRQEDADEVMAVVKAAGGMDKMHLAFYRQQAGNDGQRWHFWRLEGPGFVWNFRVLPHVHTYVNIAHKV